MIDTNPLQERIARALYENAEYYGPEDAQPPWDSRDGEERGEWMEIAAAVLPIIARLEAQSDIRVRAVVIYRERARQAEARIRAARAIHRDLYESMSGFPYCDSCDRDWPCPTIRALDGDA